jgi:hypothetical protein
VSFSDRFELLELLREDEVQTFRARERASGRAVEAHLSMSSDLLAQLESANTVIDRGSHEGKFYLVTMPLGLDSAGAWRVTPSAQQAPAQPAPVPEAAPGDFTRMFQLRQAPEPAASPAAKIAAPVPVPALQPGEFTQAFKRPERAPSAVSADSAAPGQPGEFTRMFQKPAPPVVQVVPKDAPEKSFPKAVIVIAVVILLSIAVFVFVRTLY